MVAKHRQQTAKGAPPADQGQEVRPPVVQKASGFPQLCFRHLQPGFGVEELSDEQRSEFLLKWAKRSQFTWQELSRHPRHGLGSEQLPRRVIKPQIPEQLKEDKYHVYRHQGNLPLIGTKVGDVFYVLWIEARYNDVYDHG